MRRLRSPLRFRRRRRQIRRSGAPTAQPIDRQIARAIDCVASVPDHLNLKGLCLQRCRHRRCCRCRRGRSCAATRRYAYGTVPTSNESGARHVRRNGNFLPTRFDCDCDRDCHERRDHQLHVAATVATLSSARPAISPFACVLYEGRSGPIRRVPERRGAAQPARLSFIMPPHVSRRCLLFSI